MLQNLDDQVRDCLHRAAECAERANEVTDPRERNEWLVLHGRYRALADGIERHHHDHGRIGRVNCATAMRPYRPR